MADCNFWDSLGDSVETVELDVSGSKLNPVYVQNGGDLLGARQ
jgi:hypothetical protein